MPTTVTDSPNIAVWDSRIIANTCDGDFIIDASPSVFIADGASNVLGAKVKITNPYGVIIKSYGSDYDILPPLTDTYTQAIPTQAGKQQQGVYTVVLQVTDADGTTYEVTKSVNVCSSYPSDTYPCDERIKITANCTTGKVSIAISEPPTFKGKFAQSKVQEWTVYYPTASGLEPLVTTNSYFSVQLFQGVYRIEGFCCATYNMGDNVLVSLNYNASIEKNIKCLLDYTCIWPQVKKLNEKINSNCSEKDKQAASLMVLDTLRLITSAELANKAGEDASDYISELEELLGCECTCDCSGSPIVAGTPASDVAIEGCGVGHEVVGLTHVYTIDNFQYIVDVDPIQNVITVGSPSQTDCVVKQTLQFSAANAYAAIKTQVNSTAEHNFWAGVINNTLNSLDAACLGFSPSQWAALSFSGKINALIVAACAGGACTTSISGVSVTKAGSNVLISFTQTGGYASDVYVDGIFQGNVATGINQLLVVGFVDGSTHTYSIIPKCSNGSVGTAVNGTFAFAACPSISPPVVSSNNVNDDCPYDLTTLVTTPPAGITVEWHTANNTNPATIVPNPAAVSSGVYYAFGKDADNCYSTGTQVTVTCVEAASCTAPQSLSVLFTLGNHKVSFASAASPPPANSYTVKRKPAASPDVDVSYITLGTPTFNSSTGKWEITE